MSFNFPPLCALRQRGGTLLPRQPSLAPQLVQFQIYSEAALSCICSATLWVNALWKWCTSAEEPVAPLGSLSPSDGGEASLFSPLPTCQLRQDDCRWSMKANSVSLTSSLYVATHKKTQLNSSEMKPTKHLPRYLRCAHLSRSRNIRLPEHDVVRG